MKTFYWQNNIGKAKYLVSFHDGVKTHRDGSQFFDIRIFRNKGGLNEFIDQLLSDGYREVW